MAAVGHWSIKSLFSEAPLGAREAGQYDSPSEANSLNESAQLPGNQNFRGWRDVTHDVRRVYKMRHCYDTDL
jgi:hypothetical protein